MMNYASAMQSGVGAVQQGFRLKADQLRDALAGVCVPLNMKLEASEAGYMLLCGRLTEMKLCTVFLLQAT